jgi:DNA repair protein RadD
VLIEPWDYQKEAVRLVWEALGAGRRALVVSPGGSGKTVMIAQQTADALKRGASRVLVVSHRKEIIDQTQAVLKRLGLDPKNIGVLMGAQADNLGAPIVVASMMTLVRRRTPLLASDIVVDEAHHALALGYTNVLKQYPDARHTGYTATPFRMDGKGLGDFYTEMIIAAKPSALIERKRLAKPLIYRAPEDFMPTLKDLKIARGDYAIDALAGRVNDRKLVGNIVGNWEARARGKRTIAFAVNIEHSQHIVANFKAHGIPAAHVDGAMPAEEREQILADFAAGKILVLGNCMVLSEGYDLPACEVVILARPTQSLALYIQQAARAMRYLEGKQALLMDHGRLLEQFGLPEADRDYVLTKTKANKAVWNAGPIKDCPGCGIAVPAGTQCCPNCGHMFANMARGIPTESQDSLTPYFEAERMKMEARLVAKYGADSAQTKEFMRLFVGFNTVLRPAKAAVSP